MSSISVRGTDTEAFPSFDITSVGVPVVLYSQTQFMPLICIVALTVSFNNLTSAPETRFFAAELSIFFITRASSSTIVEGVPLSPG